MQIQDSPRGLPSVILGGRLFEFSRWGAEEQTDTLFELIGILGETAGSLADLYKANKDIDADIPQDVMSRLVGKLTTGLTRDRLASKRLIMKLASGERVMCEGVQIKNYNKFYEGSLFLVFETAAANLHVQYASFFNAAASYLGTGKAAQLSAQTE